MLVQTDRRPPRSAPRCAGSAESPIPQRPAPWPIPQPAPKRQWRVRSATNVTDSKYWRGPDYEIAGDALNSTAAGYAGSFVRVRTRTVQAQRRHTTSRVSVPSGQYYGRTRWYGELEPCVLSDGGHEAATKKRISSVQNTLVATSEWRPARRREPTLRHPKTKTSSTVLG